MAEEEVAIEVKAVQAVYDEDCLVLDHFPPHLQVHIKPRTADVSSEQFVEAVLQIKAGPEYPNQQPIIDIIDSKGLDEERQKHLITSIRDKACEFSSCLMLVALCEHDEHEKAEMGLSDFWCRLGTIQKEAVEKLSAMNHPDGNCPLCLYPLFPEGKQDDIMPFMKLMSCFHCFHSECITSWWNWLQAQQEMVPDDSSGTVAQPSNEIEQERGIHGMAEGSTGNCPVCRKVFQVKDIEHVLSLVSLHSSNLHSSETEISDDDKLLHSDSEVMRRQNFEAILKLQEENSGLIEPKKNGIIVPGMFLQWPSAPPSALLAQESTSEQQQRDPVISSRTSSSGSSNRANTEQRNPGTRRHRLRNSRKPVQQWVKKDNAPRK